MRGHRAAAAKVGQHDLRQAAGVQAADQQVGGLDVAVGHARAVAGGQGGQQLRRDVRRLALAHRLQPAAEVGGQVAAAEVADEEVGGARLADVAQAQDVGAGRAQRRLRGRLGRHGRRLLLGQVVVPALGQLLGGQALAGARVGHLQHRGKGAAAHLRVAF